VPDLSANLFSISAAASHVLRHVGLSDRLTFFFQGIELFSALLTGRIHVIEMHPNQIIDGQVNAATLSDWHSRFGDVAVSKIEWMRDEGIVDDLNITNQISEGKCQECALNKCTKVCEERPEKDMSTAIKSGLSTTRPLSLARSSPSLSFFLSTRATS